MKYFLDREITIRRLKSTAGDKTAYSATATAYSAGIQTMQAEQAQLYGGDIGRLYEIYVMPIEADILDDDEIVCNENVYKVRGVKRVDFGAFPHLEIVAVLKTEEEYAIKY